MSNASKLLSNYFTLYTDNRLSTVTFLQDDFGKIIYGPLEEISKETLSTGLVPSNWKKREHCSYPQKR